MTPTRHHPLFLLLNAIPCSFFPSQGLTIDAFSREKMDATGKELCEEREEAIAACSA